MIREEAEKLKIINKRCSGLVDIGIDGEQICIVLNVHAKKAAFIVRACNNHYKLLEALKDIAEGCSFPEDEVQKAIVTRARQAIKEAEE